MFVRLKKTVLNSVVALSVGVLAPMSVTAETLADAMADAYRHSGLLQQNRALLRAADEDVASTYALLRPIISWNASVDQTYARFSSASTSGAITTSTSSSATIGIGAELLLYDAGATRYAVDAAKETVLATREGLVLAEQNVLLNAVSAFMNVLREREFVILRQNNLRLITRELRAAKDRFEVGEVTRTDVALAEARLARSRADLAGAQANLISADAFFMAAIGHQPGKLTPPRRAPRTATSLKDAEAVSVQTHPTIKQAQHQILAAESNVLRSRASMSPTVKLSGRISKTENFGSAYFTDGASVSLSMSGPIYQGGRLSSLLRKSMAQRDAQRAALHITQQSLVQDVGMAWAQLVSARSLAEASDRQIKAARIAFNGVREEAALGARTTLDVLNAEQELLDAEASRISGDTASYTASYALLAAMGLLTTEHLKLNVEQYDPEAYYNKVKDAPALMSDRGRKLDKVLRALGKE